MDDHSKGIAGDLQAKLSKEKEHRRHMFDEYWSMPHIAKLLLHKNEASMDDAWEKVAAKMIKAKTEDECDKLMANFDRSQKGLKQYLRKGTKDYQKTQWFGILMMRI